MLDLGSGGTFLAPTIIPGAAREVYKKLPGGHHFVLAECGPVGAMGTLFIAMFTDFGHKFMLQN